MRIVVNGETTEVMGHTLGQILDELGHGDAKIATAVNEEFVAASQRATLQLQSGDRVEIVEPRQGG